MFFMAYSSDVSNIDSLLDREDIELNEILDQSDIIQECKTQNSKLIEFLVQPENLSQLVDNVVSNPQEEGDEKTRFKYPHISCEVLSCDVMEIIDPLIRSEVLLDKLWSFVEQEPPLNPLSASFFGKVLTTIFSRKSTEALGYMRCHNAVDVLLRHIETSAIMQLFLNMLSVVDSRESRQPIAEWLNQEQFIEKLVKGINPAESPERHFNISQLLCELIQLSRTTTQLCLDNDPLMATIERRETIAQLLDNMFAESGSNIESALVEGVAIILSLVEPRKQTTFDMQEDTLTPPAAERIAQGVSTVLEALVPRLEDFHNVLITPPQMETMHMTTGSLVPPLGKVRLHIAWLIKAVVVTDTPSITTVLIRLSTLNVLLDLFIKYQWNNFLHTHIAHCLSAILMSEPHPGNENPMLKHLIKDCQLMTKILDVWERNDSRRRGFMGHLTNLFNDIVASKDSGASSAIINELFTDLADDEQQRWTGTVAGSLAQTNKVNNAPAQAINDTKLHSSSEEEEEYRPESSLHLGSSLNQEFENYQMQQMTDEFVESFGYNEEDLQNNDSDDNPFDDVGNIDFNINAKEETSNAAMFEAVCNQKIHQCNDAGSDDEEMWEEKELSYSSAEESKHSKPGSDGDVDDSAFQNNNDSYRDSHSSSDSSGSEEDQDCSSVTKQPDTTMDHADLFPALMQNGDASIQNSTTTMTSVLEWNETFETGGVAAMDILDSAAVGWGESSAQAVRADDVPSFANFDDMAKFPSVVQTTDQMVSDESEQKSAKHHITSNDIKMSEDCLMESSAASDTHDNQRVPSSIPMPPPSEETEISKPEVTCQDIQVDLLNSQALNPLLVTSKVISGFVVIDAPLDTGHITQEATTTTSAMSLKQISLTAVHAAGHPAETPIKENGISDSHATLATHDVE